MRMRGLLALFFEDTVVVPPPPAPEAECFPPIAPPVTAFRRLVAPGSSFSRGDVAGAAFARISAPVDVALGGYGDDYGFDYGGAESAPAAAAALFTNFDRPAVAPPVYSRQSVSGSYRRTGEPAPIFGVGYGDDYGAGYGGDEVAAAAPGYSRVAVSGKYDRQAALVDLGAVRSGAPGLSSARMDEPDCVPSIGYGDDYGFTYGGGVV